MVPPDEGNTQHLADKERTSPSRVVLHVDLDAFFVQVERSLNPTLIGQPMAVQQHADIIAVSYEARKMGVTKHMPTRVIQQQYPSVRLVHVQTLGVQNDKVSYRNYRQAARSIFTLIRAFCPSEGGDNARAGSFQKTSVDEAFLEPGRRTLKAELALSRREQDKATAAHSVLGNGKRGVKRSNLGNPQDVPNGKHVHDVGGQKRADGAVNDDRRNGFAGSPTCESGDSQSQGGTGREEEAWYVATGVSSGEGGKGDVGGTRGNGQLRGRDQDSGRFLQAGGLLGLRIQRELREVLEYDCSVGVAENKFLAKLATNLAKPKGVRVLHRRDVPSVLANTPATKIPGCGAGSAAARQIAQWGVKSVLDLRRIEAQELRDRLGDQLGAKVHDRCRGIDNDAVEPNPVPSRVSSSMSLVPLIKPAYCLGKPGEKLTPVYPWEVARLRAHVVTLVDDLIDRMKEELDERNRRPTKICLEYHLHKRGSKSQTFCLPSAPPSVRPTPVDLSLLALSQPTASADDTTNMLGLPPAATLVELALTPFKSYRRGGPTGGDQGQAKSSTESPPVVKLVLAILAFDSEGKSAATMGTTAPGQRTLEGMMWLGRDSAPTATTERKGRANGTVDEPHEAGSPGNSAAVEGATETLVSLSASEAPALATSTPASGPSRTSPVKSPSSPGHERYSKKIQNTVLAENTVLIRCPRCKACLSLGDGWDSHREEHLVFEGESRRQSDSTQNVKNNSELTSFQPTTPRQQTRTLSVASVSHPAIRIPREPSLPIAWASAGNSDEYGDARSAKSRLVVGDGNSQDLDRLSDLLYLAVTPSQAADVLRERGLLGSDGQTRFAHVLRDAE